MTSMSCVMTVPRLAWHPPEHARTLDVTSDWVQEEGALQPRLVPLRVHEGGVQQELLVEQDAVAPLWIDTKQAVWTRKCSVDHHVSPIICAYHRSCKKKHIFRKILPGNRYPNSGVFCRNPVMRCRNSW